MSFTNDQTTAKNFQKFYQAIEPYLNGATHTGYTPVGSIIAIMGNTAPPNYLACDGTVYNINDYLELATYFEQQFEAKNYFGGDGVTTFAVPDLRGEFLRGAGENSHETTYAGSTLKQGDGGDVGEHQNATVHVAVYTTEGNLIGRKQNSTTGLNLSAPDSSVSSGTYAKVATSNGSSTAPAGYTSRPTNTSVLYCIATKNIFIDTHDMADTVDAEDVADMIADNPPVARDNFQKYATYEQVVGEWIDGKPLYQKTIDCGTVITKTVAHGVSNIDEVCDIVPIVRDNTTSNYHYFHAMILLSSTPANNINLNVDNTNLNISTSNSTLATYTMKVTIKYTKTTD